MSKPTKGDRYLQLLEDARCEDNWDAIPELVRKVRKHAPERRCLALTAETEHIITKAQFKQTSVTRPVTALDTKDLEITSILPKLLAAVEEEKKYAEDRFQGQVCVGWLHWAVGEYELAAVRLPQNLEHEYSQFDQTAGPSEWTRVCTLKTAYLKANCLSRHNKRVESLAVFESALISLSSVWNGQQGRKQLQFWAELFLTEYCMLQSQTLERSEKSLDEPNCLASYRTWARYWEASREQGSPLAGGHGFRGAVPRRRVWNEYYNAVSGILKHDFPFPTAYVDSVTNNASARSELRMELKKIEAAYESLLLSETSFPKADEDREEVENFITTVMENWNILSGREWQDNDLGPDGKEGLSRGVLEILYRAATKTFHSTAILRHLFTVHLAVAEFDMAFKAFDSYLDIVQKGKARVDKTGHPEASLDEDATMIETISKAIMALCKYGSRAAAEKARDLGVVLEETLQKLPSPLPNTDDDNIPTLQEENANGAVLHPKISAKVNGLAWQAIGLAHAQWSRNTYDAESRTEIQFKAIRSFQKSLSPETGNPTDIRTLFSLALLLAEQRELSAAIDIAKAALMSNKKAGGREASAGSYWRERSLIPVWHLLALLLSARQDYVMAARACEGAFEQFDDPSVLFGTQSLQGNYRSDHLNEVGSQNGTGHGLVDEMDDLEKEAIIEVKMTQLALVELLEGPEIAVNASHELLVLYTRLFGSSNPTAPPAPPKTAQLPPKSAAGTIRSIRGSIFGGKSGKAPRHMRQVSEMSEKTTTSTRPQTAIGTTATSTPIPPTPPTPTIQVTQETNGASVDARSIKSMPSVRGRQRSSSVKRRNSLKRRDSNAHARSMSVSSAHTQPEIADGDAYFTPLGDTAANDRPDFFATHGKKNSFSSQQPLSKAKALLRFESGVSSLKSSLSGSETPVVESLSPPHSLPVIQFPKDQVKRQRWAVLIKVWLMIGAFYRQAKMHGDAQGAIDEARKLVDTLEADLAKDNGGFAPTSSQPWGAKKSVEELWGDVRSEMAYLSLAEGTPYQARARFEEALMHCPNHPSAIVGLSNILLDIYSEVLLPPPAIQDLTLPDGEPAGLGGAAPEAHKTQTIRQKSGGILSGLPSTPLGLGGSSSAAIQTANSSCPKTTKPTNPASGAELPAPYKAVSLPLVDRLAARDRAYGLLSGLTKLGSGWNYSDAWFALARAHEESDQPDKAKDALWWCVELEEGMGVRDWNSMGGYVLY